MQTHQLSPIHGLKRDKRVGRGGKKGTYSGRGGKGQTARAGRKVAPIIRELIKRYPKLRGYRAFAMPTMVQVVNLDIVAKISKDGDVISPKMLLEKGVIRHMNGHIPQIKVLGRGSITKKITIEGCKVSASARAAIEKAGGAIKA